MAIFLNTATPDKARKAVDKIADALSLDLSGAKIERYWKDKDLFKVNATSRVEGATPADAFYRIMGTMRGIATRCVITLPDEDGIFEFGGAVNPGESRLQGIESVSFNVCEVAEPQVYRGAEAIPLPIRTLSPVDRTDGS
ncbi:MAG TPA: hypothetical protein PK867_00650 [Pirellulales bacterium]|nr:hypothetical protein [Pirellulales bacterium]